MKVRTDISGSKLVVFLSPERYIDVKHDVRYPAHSFIEVVRSGRVRRRQTVHDSEAPEAIIKLMRSNKV